MDYSLVQTPLGTIAVGFDGDGLTRVLLPERDWGEPSKAQLERAGLKRRVDAPFTDFKRQPLSCKGVPPFLLKVQRAAQTIPPGETRTYGQLAEMAGNPKAVRAVGTAMATNRWPVVVPCHRVFASNGFGAYSAGQGLHTKLRLLWGEGYRGPTSNVTFSTETARAQIMGDVRMAKLLDAAGPFTVQTTRLQQTPFEALASSIVYQQLSGKAAATIHARVIAALGAMTPERVLNTKKPLLRAAGLSENKALSLIDLAVKTDKGQLPSRAQMERMDDQALLEAMSAVRGIGRWSGQMLLMFYLGRPDVLPLLDLGVRKGFQRLMRSRALPSEQTLQRAAKQWAPYRSVASWYLWRATELPEDYFTRV